MGEVMQNGGHHEGDLLSKYSRDGWASK